MCIKFTRMKLSIAFMWLLLAVLFRNADGLCYSSTKYALPFLRAISNVHYTNNEHCIIYIRPSGAYSSTNYYLEIKWTSFDIEGNMPNCKDYVEVFLTRYWLFCIDLQICMANQERIQTIETVARAIVKISVFDFRNSHLKAAV